MPGCILQKANQVAAIDIRDSLNEASRSVLGVAVSRESVGHLLGGVYSKYNIGAVSGGVSGAGVLQLVPLVALSV